VRELAVATALCRSLAGRRRRTVRACGRRCLTQGRVDLPQRREVLDHPVDEHRLQHVDELVVHLRLEIVGSGAVSPTASAGWVATTTSRSAPSASAGLSGALRRTPPSEYHRRPPLGWGRSIAGNATGIAAEATRWSVVSSVAT
jgi:hypothetical protein